MQHPGLLQDVAEVFVAETGGDMTVFPTAGHLASWAGMSPGSNESAGRMKSTKTRPGNRYFKGALGVAAIAAARSKNSYFSAKYKRIAAARPHARGRGRRTRPHIAAWNMLDNGVSTAIPEPTITPTTNPPKPKPGPSANSKPSDTESPSNHSPKPGDTPARWVTCSGHLIFMSVGG